MIQSVLVNGNFEGRESVLDRFESWICEGMYVNEVDCYPKPQRQGWVTEVIDENNGLGKIKVKIVRKGDDFLDEQSSYVTDFEPSTHWCKALTDG